MIRIGTAGWSVPRAVAEAFPTEGSALQRYAARLDAVEINSSFYRPHRRATYERWAASTPDGFRFAVKAPKTVTHERRLVDCDEPLDRFLDEVAGLGGKLGPLLVQLPPSLAFDPGVASAFTDLLRSRFDGRVALEPRHASWLGKEAEALLLERRIARVAADPALNEAVAEPGGWTGLVYHRLHGSPRIYWSDYPPTYLETLAPTLYGDAARAETWCIFDNTAAGHAAGNALEIWRLLGVGGPQRD